MPPPTLRTAQDEGPVDLLELEERVREGEVLGEALLHHAPWTGQDFVRLDRLPAFAEALQAPSARFAAHLTAPGHSRGAALLGVLVMVSAFAQTALSAMGTPEAQDLLERALREGVLHWEGAVLDGSWWSVWTAHLLHAPGAALVHAVANLPFLAYCGYRVERAWGHTGLLRVLAGSLLVGSVAVLLFSDLPVLGSSILAFGLFGAQIAIGFRMGEAIPPSQRGRYGWGSLRAFVLFLALTMALEFWMVGHRGPSSGVSHLGHASGLLGGVLAVMVGTPPVLRPSPPRFTAHLAITGLLLLIPAALGPLLALSPGLAGQPWREVQVEGTGLSLSLPARFAETPVRQFGLQGFAASRASQHPILVDQALFSSYEAVEELDWEAWWGQRLGGVATSLPAPPARGAGWTAHAWEVDGEVVVEHRFRQGLVLSRVAWVLEAPAPARERFYRHLLEGLQIAEPPALVAERELYGRNPDSPRRQHALARELFIAGRFAEADTMLVPLLQRQDGWQWNAARTRLRLFEVDPPTGAEVPVGWLLPFLEEAPASDREILEPGFAWLVARGACAEAAQALQRWEELPEALESSAEWVQATCH